jgi:hypothetical protein
MPTAALTTGTVSLVITIVGGWLWVTTFFMTAEQAETEHQALGIEIADVRQQAYDWKEELLKTVRRVEYEGRITQAESELSYLEDIPPDVITPTDERRHRLLIRQVEDFTSRLEDLK